MLSGVPPSREARGRRLRTGLALALILALAGFSLIEPRTLAADGSPNVVISQVYGGGGNSGGVYTNDFVELFNRGTAPVSLAGWSIQYASSTGTGNFGANSGQITPLPAVTLQPGQYLLVQEAAGTNTFAPLPTPDVIDSTPINMSGTGGKVALVNTTTPLGCNGGSAPCSAAALATIVDLVGWDGANFFEGAAAPPTTNGTAIIRNGNGCWDTNNNALDFIAAAPVPRNTATPFNVCPLSTPPTGVGATAPAAVEPGGSVLLTVTVTPGGNPPSTGISVSADLSAIGVPGLQTFFDDGTNGDVTAGDLVFSFATTVASSTEAGQKAVAFTVSDAQGRSSAGTMRVTVAPIVKIHDVQGPTTFSPYAGQLVSVVGIVTGIKSNAFFVEAPFAEWDASPATSEGLEIYGSVPAGLAIGNEVKVTGTVSDYVSSSYPGDIPLTEISGSFAFQLLDANAPLPPAQTIAAEDASASGPRDQLAKFEGMRVHVDSMTTVSGTGGTITEASATSSSNDTFFAVVTGVARPFREPGLDPTVTVPPGLPPMVPRFDGNPELLRIDCRAIVDPPGYPNPHDVTAGQVVTNVNGVVDQVSGVYTIVADPTDPPVVGGTPESAGAVPVPAADEFTVASFNMQRFFNDADDSATGGPVLTATAFATRLAKASLAIRTVLREPDIIGVQEVENLATLQAIAARVNEDAAAQGPNPGYVAYLEEGNDPGGIDVGFLVKARVAVTNVTQDGKDATYVNPNTNLPEMLNDRPPLVLRATVAHPGGLSPFPVTVVVNHLRSLSGIDSETTPSGDPDGPRVRAKRRAQAEYLAELIQQHQSAGERVVSVGDYNAYQFADGLVDVVGTVEGLPATADQVLLTSPDLVNPDLVDLVNTLPLDQRYSYIENGNAQVLDHALVSSSLMASFSRFAYARVDADFPEAYRNDATRPERISDHDMPVAYFKLPAPSVGPVAADKTILWPPNHKLTDVVLQYQVADNWAPVGCSLAVSSNQAANGTGDGNTPTDWLVVDAEGAQPHHLLLRAERSGDAARVYTVTVTCTNDAGQAALPVSVQVGVPADQGKQ